MEKVQNPSNSEYYAPSSEPYRIYKTMFIVFTEQLSFANRFILHEVALLTLLPLKKPGDNGILDK
jgi:hypothetical protein